MTWSYIEKTPKSPPKNLLELINEFSKFAGYVVSKDKHVAFLNASNELSQRKQFGLKLHQKE